MKTKINKLNKLNKFELNRQLFHLIFGIILVLLIKLGILTKLLLALITLAAIIASLISKKIKLPVINYFLEKFERPSQLKKFPGKGVIYYLLGSLIVFAFFEKDIALASITILAVADSASNVIGFHFGKIRHPLSDKKFLEGAMAGIILAAIAALIFVTLPEAFLASLAAMIAEGIEIKLGMQQVDDNLVMPIVAGIVIKAIRTMGLV